jgi:hypothetical protein
MTDEQKQRINERIHKSKNRVDGFITDLYLLEPEATEAESIKLFWAAIDELERFGVTWKLRSNAVTGDAEIALNVEKVPALHHRTVYQEIAEPTK